MTTIVLFSEATTGGVLGKKMFLKRLVCFSSIKNLCDKLMDKVRMIEKFVLLEVAGVVYFFENDTEAAVSRCSSN